jgi:AP2 domain
VTFINMPRPVYTCQCGDHAWTALTLGYVTLVSPQDAHLLEKRAWRAFHLKSKRQVYATTSHRSVRLHRVILELTDDAFHGDHINNNGLDNRRPNLRAATRNQNAHNCSSHRDSTSKFLGVSWDKRTKLWISQISIKGRNTKIGSFADEETAARSYDTWARKEYGEFARLNFP